MRNFLRGRIKAGPFSSKRKRTKKNLFDEYAFALRHVIPNKFLFLRRFFSLYKEKKRQKKPQSTKNLNSVLDRWVSPARTLGWGQAG